jgi:hypothetical protein
MFYRSKYHSGKVFGLNKLTWIILNVRDVSVIMKSVYLLGLGEVKQTVNTAIVIDRLTNKAIVKKIRTDVFMRKQKQNLFLSKENVKSIDIMK